MVFGKHRSPFSNCGCCCALPVFVQDMNENIEERINMQKAVFEIEDATFSIQC
jgi:hypothetical protein